MFNMNNKSRKYQESTIYVENMSQFILKTICTNIATKNLIVLTQSFLKLLDHMFITYFQHIRRDFCPYALNMYIRQNQKV